MSDTLRLDALLAERGLAASRSQGADLIRRGLVRLGGQVVTKPGRRVARRADIAVAPEAQPYVSRGGLKLAAALDHFAFDVAGCRALDLGASTGGFTDVLLRRGAAHVTALDAGHGQLHDSLRGDARVLCLEKLNARDLEPGHLPGPVDLIVCDVSFISLKLALPPALKLAAEGAALIALIKPQFEVGRAALGKGGIVRDPALHQQTCADISAWLEGDCGWRVTGLMPSPLTGPDGNREFLIAALKELR